MRSSFVLDAEIADALARLTAKRSELVAPTQLGAGTLEQFIQKLARLLVIDAERRCVEAATLVEISPTWRGYDDAPPEVQAVLDTYNEVIAPIKGMAARMLGHPDAAEYLISHADDPLVWSALARTSPSRTLTNRMLQARAGRQERQFGARKLTFLGGGAKVVVDDRVSYGPATPDIIASAGRQVGADGPQFLLQRRFEHRDDFLCVDLVNLRFTSFQREGVVTHRPYIESIDEEGVVIRLHSGDTQRRTWDEFIWHPLDAFET